MGGERGLGTGYQLCRRLPCRIKPHQHNKACLPAISVLPGGFAKRRFITAVIEKIIRNLEGQTEITRISRKRRFERLTGTAVNATGNGRELDQRAGLHALHLPHLFKRHGAVLRLEIQHLATCHPSDAGRRCQRRHQPGTPHRIMMCRRIGQQPEGKCLQGVARKYGRRLVKGDMAGRRAPAGRGIIHCGQVVMDQGIGMKAFDGSGDIQRAVSLRHPTGKSRGCHHKGGTKTFASIHRGVTHGLDKACRGTG